MRLVSVNAESHALKCDLLSIKDKQFLANKYVNNNLICACIYSIFCCCMQPIVCQVDVLVPLIVGYNFLVLIDGYCLIYILPFAYLKMLFREFSFLSQVVVDISPEIAPLFSINLIWDTKAPISLL